MSGWRRRVRRPLAGGRRSTVDRAGPAAHNGAAGRWLRRSCGSRTGGGGTFWRFAVGLAALVKASTRGLGPYGLQAAIAAAHASAPSVEATDWDRIVVLYEALGRVAPSPVVELNRAVAVAMASGPAQALAIVDELIALDRLPGSHLVPTVRGELLARLGRRPGGARRAGAGGPAVRQPARTLSAAAQGGRAGLTSPARPAGIRARPGCRRSRRPDGQAQRRLRHAGAATIASAASADPRTRTAGARRTR